MRPYGEFCPISRAAELLGERWTTQVIRELFCGSTRFSELQSGIPGVPKSLLTKRLRKLEDADIIRRNFGDGPRKVTYQLTQQGLELGEVILALGSWSQRWYNRELTDDRVEPSLLVWDMRRRVHTDRLPEKRVVTQFDFSGAAQERLWLILERPQPSACDFDPGFDVDIYVQADALELTRIWMGLRSWKAAMAEGKLVLSGPSELTRNFPDWFQMNVFASVPAGRLTAPVA